MKTMAGSIRPRSATAPMARAGVMAANMPWNRQKRMSGVVSAPFGAAMVFISPNCDKSPRNALPVREKVRE